MNKRLPLSAGTILQSRYTIVGQLGHGGMGAVYEAKDNRISASVALKETYAADDYTRNAFEREAKMLANLTHEAFPRVMDYFAEGDGFYLVMELIRGKDLSELLEERNAPFETEQVLEWADQILDALEDLHSQDIVHLDIKPSNLKLTPRGRIKLLDFGIAKGAAGDMTTLQSTVGSMAAATLQYAPLEQVLRADTNWLQMLCVNFSDKTLSILDHGTDARSDIYALGATLYHLLTNTVPVNAPTRALSVWTGLADKLRPAHEINPKVSSSVSTALQKATEIDRERRPKSASEMRKMLAEVGNDEDEETIHASIERTPSILPPTVVQDPKTQAAETEILDHNSPVDFHQAVDKQEVETVVRVLPSNVNSKRRKIYASAVIGIFAVALISLGLLFLIYGPTANKSRSMGNAPTSTTELANIPAGSFMMGSDNGRPDEKPVHKVTISKPFLLGKYEVTQEEWQSVMGNNPSNFKNCPKCPVEQVSWNDTQEFINKLNAKNDGFNYRLPTEAEWEYACRAGTKGDYYGNPDSIAWYISNSGNKTHPVGQKQPNAFRLYDMSGNVWEWCQDWQGSYTDAAATDPVGPSNGESRILRGGSWEYYSAFFSRSSGRGGDSPSDRLSDRGFRVAARPK